MEHWWLEALRYRLRSALLLHSFVCNLSSPLLSSSLLSALLSAPRGSCWSPKGIPRFSSALLCLHTTLHTMLVYTRWLYTQPVLYTLSASLHISCSAHSRTSHAHVIPSIIQPYHVIMAPGDAAPRNLTQAQQSSYPCLPAVPRLAAELRTVLHHSTPVQIGSTQASPCAPLGFGVEFESIPHPDHIPPNIIPPFIPSSRDPLLHRLSVENRCDFAGSTSSIGKLLSHAYYLITGNRSVSLRGLSSAFQSMANNITRAQHLPAIVLLRRSSSMSSFGASRHYTIDSFPSIRHPNFLILMKLGHVLEAQMTHEPSEFKRMLLGYSSSSDDHTYLYCQSGKLLLRSQLDCFDEQLAQHK